MSENVDSSKQKSKSENHLFEAIDKMVVRAKPVSKEPPTPQPKNNKKDK